jgi:hypothetical protein
VHVTNDEAPGAARSRDAAGILPRVHVAVGLKEHSAVAHASHLLSAKVQFLTHMLVVEILAPEMTRPKDHRLYDGPLLTVE